MQSLVARNPELSSVTLVLDTRRRKNLQASVDARNDALKRTSNPARRAVHSRGTLTQSHAKRRKLRDRKVDKRKSKAHTLRATNRKPHAASSAREARKTITDADKATTRSPLMQSASTPLQAPTGASKTRRRTTHASADLSYREGPSPISRSPTPLRVLRKSTSQRGNNATEHIKVQIPKRKQVRGI